MVRFWKKSISGEWLEFAETDLTDEYVFLLSRSLCHGLILFTRPNGA